MSLKMEEKEDGTNPFIIFRVSMTASYKKEAGSGSVPFPASSYDFDEIYRISRPALHGVTTPDWVHFATDCE
jgi:hypothetical protein